MDNELKLGGKLFADKKFAEAVVVYQSYIAGHVGEWMDIDGMGNNEDSIGYYEWRISEWYI